MGIIFAYTSSYVADLSFRAIIRTIIAIVLLLLLTNYLKKDPHIKQILFVLFAAVILFTSTVLIATAIVHLQEVL